MYEEKSRTLLLSTLAADSYCLGSHWVYEPAELQNLDINWDVLNKPHVAWHEGKTQGDFTHYGDQILILNNFLKDKETFDIKEYMRYWRLQMNDFKGYVDGSIKDTIENIDKGLEVPCGSSSHDMSVVGRIIPLLKVSKSKVEFLENVKLLAQATHNNEEVLESITFFAELLVEVLDGNGIKESIEKLKNNYSNNIQNFISLGLNSKDNNTVETILKFGQACPIEFCFPSVIHLLSKHDNYQEALIQNAKAGGDSSSRGMIVAYILSASTNANIVPDNWLEFNAKV